MWLYIIIVMGIFATTLFLSVRHCKSKDKAEKKSNSDSCRDCCHPHSKNDPPPNG